MTYFGQFCYLNSSWITKSITLMFMSSSRNKFTLLYQNSVTDVFVGFRPPCWCPSRWAPAWRLHTNLYKFARNISSDISYTEYSSDLNLGEKFGIFTSFHFPHSWRRKYRAKPTSSPGSSRFFNMAVAGEIRNHVPRILF